MTPQERQSIVWAVIERMAFRPNPAGTWMALYERTIHRLWEIQSGDVVIRHNTEFQVPFLNIICQYHLVERVGKKYDASIRLTGDQSCFLWTVHVDPDYASKAALHNESRTVTNVKTALAIYTTMWRAFWMAWSFTRAITLTLRSVD